MHIRNGIILDIVLIPTCVIQVRKWSTKLLLTRLIIFEELKLWYMIRYIHFIPIFRLHYHHNLSTFRIDEQMQWKYLCIISPWRNVIGILYTTIRLIFLHSTFLIRCDSLIGLTFTFPPPARCFAFASDPTLEVVFHSSFRFSIYSVRGIYMEIKRDLLRNQYDNIKS